MKWGIGLFGLLLASGIIYVAGMFGYQMGGDDTTDAWVWACGFGAISLAGICGFMVAVRLWGYGKYGWCTVVVLLGAVTVLISLSNGVGAVSGRMNKAQSARAKANKEARGDQKKLDGMQTEREALRSVDFANDDTVTAATAVAANAGTTRYNECRNGRGTACIQREQEETQAIKDKAKAISDRNKTNRAADLDRLIPIQEAKVKNDGAELRENNQGIALASLLGLKQDDADWVMTRQNFGIAAVVEALAAICLALFEVMYTHEAAERAKISIRETPVIVERVIPTAMAFTAPPKPRLISSQHDGNVAVIMADIINPGSGKVEIAECYRAYASECAARGKRPVSEAEFSATMAALCRRLGIQIEDDGTGIHLLNVRLKTSEKRELEDQAS